MLPVLKKFKKYICLIFRARTVFNRHIIIISLVNNLLVMLKYLCQITELSRSSVTLIFFRQALHKKKKKKLEFNSEISCDADVKLFTNN